MYSMPESNKWKMTGPLPRALPSAMATAPPGMRSPVKATNSPKTPPVLYLERYVILRSKALNTYSIDYFRQRLFNGDTDVSQGF